MRKVVVEPRARREIEGQIDYLAARAPKAAEKAFDRLFNVIRALGEFPEIGQAVANGHREMVVRFGKYGFIVRYYVTAETVIVRRVFHGSQER